MNDYERAIRIVHAIYGKDWLELETKRLDVTMAFVRLFTPREDFDASVFFDRAMRRVKAAA